MPTGHSSSGGSSHSGGSFGGGSSHSGGSSHGGGGPMHYGRGVIIINNRPYRMKGGASAGFVVATIMAVVFIFVAFAGGIMMSNAGNTKRQIESDFDNYYKVVNTAKQHSDRIVVGRIKSIERGYNRNRIIYSFVYKGQILEGYSFYVYTADDLDDLDYEIGGEIEIALDLSSYHTYGEPDSIPLDFNQFEVDDDGEYLQANTNFGVGIALLIVGIALTIACFVVGNVVKRKFAKPYDDNAGETNESQPKKEISEQASYCEYCGTRLKPGEDKCPGCGARKGK